MKNLPLSKLTDIQTGPFGSQLHKEDYVEIGTPIVTVEHLGSRTFTEQNLPRVKDEDRERLSKYVLHTGDIVFSRVGSVDRCSYVNEAHDGWMFSGRCLRVRPTDEIDSRYLYYYFCREETKQFIRSVAVGATMPSINTKLLGEVNIAYPDIAEQRKISDILSVIDDKIELNTAVNDNLQQQAAMIFREWFITNPETEMWPLVTLDSLTSLISRGITPKYNDDSTQVVLNQKCIRDHFIDTSLARKHSPKAINEKWLKYGDLLINSTGEGTLGRTAQVWFVPENMTVDSHVTIARPKNQQLIFYIGLWGLSHEREIESLHTGSTGQTELPRDRVKALELRMPDSDILTRFNSVIEPMVSSTIVNQQENSRLANIRDALLPKLMSGEIDVSDIRI